MPDIHFKGRVAPDYLIGFGPWTKEVGEVRDLFSPRGVQYAQIDTIHVFWQDRYRPERIWRSFVTLEPKPGEEIYIYKRIDRRH